MIEIGIIILVVVMMAILFSGDAEKCPECGGIMELNSYDYFQCTNCNFYFEDKWKTESSDKETSNQ